MKKNISIALVGGHLAPAYAVGSYIKKNHPDVPVIFFGRQKSFTSQKSASDSVEHDVMKKVSEKVYLLPVERVSWNPLSWMSFLRSLFQTISCLSESTPSVVVSFGGYVGFVVGVAAVIKRIPVILQEQTHALGQANKLLEPFSKKVLVSYSELQSTKRIFTGFPLRDDVVSPPKELSFQLLSKKPILYITGGTTGAVTLNDLCFVILNDLLATFTVVHQTGNLSLAKAELLKEKLSEEKKSLYYCFSYIDPADAAYLFHKASAVICRSGANTTYELAVTKTPSVIIPLPVNDEQMQNALWLKKYASTIILPQRETTSQKVLEAITQITTGDPKKTSFPLMVTDGTKRIVEEIFSVL